MPRGPSQQRATRTRKFLWGALAGVILLGAFLWHERSISRRTEDEERRPELAPASPPPNPGGPARSRLPPAPAVATASPAPAPPIIDEIRVEKPEVCEGEENLVTVRAHTPDGNDAFLHYQIGPTRGRAVALHSFIDNRGEPTHHRVAVFSKNNAASWADVPAYRVKRCDTLPVAVLEYRLLPNAWADFELTGKVMPAVPSRAAGADPRPFRPRRYRWTFDDGAPVVEGDSPRVEHSFAGRPQETLFSSMLVRLDVIAEDGRIATARQSLELLNSSFEAFATKRIVQLMVELDPRFPVMSDSGLVEQGVRLWHAWQQPVEISRLTLVRRHVGDGGVANREYPPVASVLGGATSVPPGRGLDLHLVLDTRREPDTISLDYFLEGRTPEGYPVRGSFSLMRPPAPPTREHHAPVRDPLLVAKIQRARELLRRDLVTDEDLWTLERDGRFEGLQVEPGAPPSAGLPPELPRARPAR